MQWYTSRWYTRSSMCEGLSCTCVQKLVTQNPHTATRQLFSFLAHCLALPGLCSFLSHIYTVWRQKNWSPIGTSTDGKRNAQRNARLHVLSSVSCITLYMYIWDAVPTCSGSLFSMKYYLFKILVQCIKCCKPLQYRCQLDQITQVSSFRVCVNIRILINKKV